MGEVEHIPFQPHEEDIASGGFSDDVARGLEISTNEGMRHKPPTNDASHKIKVRGLDTHGAAGPAVVKPADQLSANERQQIANSEALARSRRTQKLR